MVEASYQHTLLLSECVCIVEAALLIKWFDCWTKCVVGVALGLDSPSI